MRPPRLVVNLKAYPEALGPGALRFAQAAQAAAAEVGGHIAVAVPATELAMLARGQAFSRVAVLAQHVDPKAAGAATGWLPAAAVAAAGARGSLVNHAEHKLPHPDVAACVTALGAAGLWSLACADSRNEASALAAMRPTWVAVEPPELIGGSVSVTTADPAIVRDAATDVVKRAPETLVLCGAGVKNGADAAAAVRLGAYGVLLASGIVKAPDPRQALVDLLRALP